MIVSCVFDLLTQAMHDAGCRYVPNERYKDLIAVFERFDMNNVIRTVRIYHGKYVPIALGHEVITYDAAIACLAKPAMVAKEPDIVKMSRVVAADPATDPEQIAADVVQWLKSDEPITSWMKWNGSTFVTQPWLWK